MSYVRKPFSFLTPIAFPLGHKQLFIDFGETSHTFLIGPFKSHNYPCSLFVEGRSSFKGPQDSSPGPEIIVCESPGVSSTYLWLSTVPALRCPNHPYTIVPAPWRPHTLRWKGLRTSHWGRFSQWSPAVSSVVLCGHRDHSVLKANLQEPPAETKPHLPSPGPWFFPCLFVPISMLNPNKTHSQGPFQNLTARRYTSWDQK